MADQAEADLAQQGDGQGISWEPVCLYHSFAGLQSMANMSLTRHRFFNWHALGVPKNQMNCFLEDGTVEEFITATLDPIPGLSKLKVRLLSLYRVRECQSLIEVAG